MKVSGLIVFVLFITFSCSNSKSAVSDGNGSFNDSEYQTDDLLPGDNGTLPGDDDPDGSQDADVDYPERECETECGKGVEQLIAGEWVNCTAPGDGFERECEKGNTFGICEGSETCSIPGGWGECDAPEAEPEYYDGLDNNCNGETDENIINPVTDGALDEGLEKIDKTDPDNPTGSDGITLSRKTKTLPYLWAANHEYGSVSKFNTETNIEEARYWVGLNPSRTAVDLDGNMWVGGRDDGRLTKVLWDISKCPDTNGTPGIQTSYLDTFGTVNQINSSEAPFADDCVVFSQVINADWPSIRGLAVAPDGKIWIGYSYGGVQSIDPVTFEVGPYYSALSVPVWRPDGSNVFKLAAGETINADGVYGLIADSKGLLYISALNNRKLLTCFDTNTETWIGAFEKTGACSYGIAVDAKNRIWLGGYPECSGVVMFDYENKMAFSFVVPDSAALTPVGISSVTVIPNGAGGGKAGHDTTGVTVDPSTGDIWTSFYQHGYTGRLIIDEYDITKSTWNFIATTRDDSNVLLPGVAVDLRGVGFDPLGFAWTLGLGSDRVWKIDPATNKRAADLPEGKSIGVGSHYTYSDFTGSTAFNFTAPRGTWDYKFGRPTSCSIPSAIFVQAYVPEKTFIGLRMRTLDNSEAPVSNWLPEDVTAEKYFVIPAGLGETEIDLADYESYFTITKKYEIEVLMTTSDKSILPILNNVNVLWEYNSSACDN